jgi:hypothetical protein
MESFTKIFNDFKKLSKETQYIFILTLLNDNIITYNKISDLYVLHLESLKEQARSKDCMYANCLGSYINGWNKTNESFFESMAYILLKEREPEGFINTYLKKRNKKDIEKIKNLMSLKKM